jgi:uncharacterized protein YjbI with pentapeptide repeats
MKLTLPDAAAATALSPINWFLGICLAAFLATISASAAAPQIDAEEWVAAQVTAGEIADLVEQFPEKENRKLSAHFLEDLLTGTRLHRHGVRIKGAIIDEPIDLENAQVRCEVWLDDCQFNKSVTFARANFASGLLFHGSRCKESANFNGMKLGGTASFRGAVFEGPVDFVGADIANNFEAQAAHFQNKEKYASFNGMKVGGDAVFNDTFFEGQLNLIRGDVGLAKFYAFFNSAVFEGPVAFSYADIARNFIADGVRFQNKEKYASFGSMKVGGTASFRRAVFKGPVDFVGADIASEFVAQGAEFHNKETGAGFSSMKVRGSAFFNSAVFKGPVDLHYADFAWLNLSNTVWPERAAHFDMQGMSYKYIRAAQGTEPESHEALLKLAEQSAYIADVYSKLEEFFLRQGYRGDADRAFIEGKRRERKEYLHGFDWVGSWMLDLLVGYGRRPWQAGIPCAALVALGCVLFSPKKMEPQKPEEAHRLYNRFWYSLDLFLPFVDLQADDVWKPKTNERFLRHYVRLHVMLGWILIPIVLAALTGLIK